jgi:sugar/nucleoside kinase (ribokinase family)
MSKIIVVGDIVTDVVTIVSEPLHIGSDTPASITMTAGGAGANTAAWLAALGVEVTLCGVVGDDEPGDIRLAELEVRGVTCAIRRDPEARTGSIVVLADHEERTMITDRGANRGLTPDDVEAAFASASQAVHLHLSGYPLLDEASRPAAMHALALAAERGLTTSVDAASAEPLRRAGAERFLEWVRAADMLFVNTDEAIALVGAGEPETLVRALAKHCGVAVLKLGAAGAMAYALGSGAVDTVAAAETTALDATGAGDAFAAGYLAAAIAGGSRAEALTVAAEMGAQAVHAIGAPPPAA